MTTIRGGVTTANCTPSAYTLNPVLIDDVYFIKDADRIFSTDFE